MSEGHSPSVSKSVEKDLLKILIQEKRERPRSLEVDEVKDIIGADYDADTVTQAIDILADRPGKTLEYLTSDEECVTVRDLDEAGDRFTQLMDEQRDDFFG